ncbi:MAG: 2-amino-4-hydroxy-6-hydroxymethyldihydropteridine diphosphokinase, partial [Acidobacteriota bacterium]|nr:2-amino-4-hydroxy-6-hydroxymethyldihydropteridine diphosphokinase [Acidobacteriota bacterium]
LRESLRPQRLRGELPAALHTRCENIEMLSMREDSAELAYIGIGSNLGDRAGNLLLGVRGMMSAGLCVSRLSSIFETEPVGVEGVQPAYLNMVAELCETLPPPEELLALLLKIEHAHGRRRSGQTRAPRTLDLDLLLYADAKHETETLTLPHPRLHLRRFVLVPLAELVPAARHPTTGQTYSELLDATEDHSEVTLWKP